MGLDSVEFAMEVEREFGVKIPDEFWPEHKTVGEVVELVHKMLQSLGKPMDRALVSESVRKLAAQNAGLKVESISEDSDMWEIFD